MGLPAARISDMHACPIHGGGPILTGQPNVLIGGKPASRITDQTAHGGVIVQGCPTVLIGNNPGKCLAQATQSNATFVQAMQEE